MSRSRPISSPRPLKNAQRKVEGHNFDIRKHLLEYDDVMNQQREVIYGQRRNILSGENMREDILGMIQDISEQLVESFTDDKSFAEDWDFSGPLGSGLQDLWFPP